MELPSRDAEHRKRVGRDANDLAALFSLTREPDAVVEDEIKGQAKALIAQAIAAVLVAAIQAQSLSFSIIHEASNLKVATNALFFIGILCNIMGAFYALTSAYSLETNLGNMRAILHDLTDKELADVTELPLSPLVKRLAKQHRSNRRSTIVVAEEGGVVNSNLFKKTPLERLSRSIQRNKHAGRLGSGAIAIGFITCPPAFLCLIQDTQPLAVRITAFIVVGILLLTRFLLIPMQDMSSWARHWFWY